MRRRLKLVVRRGRELSVRIDIMAFGSCSNVRFNNNIVVVGGCCCGMAGEWRGGLVGGVVVAWETLSKITL